MRSSLHSSYAKPARRSVVWLLCLLLGWSGLTQAQTVRYVRPTGSGSGNGSNWANASSDLQAIINASNAGDQVWVAAGTYNPGGSSNISNGLPISNQTLSFSMKDGVAIYGGFVGSETSLSQRPAVDPVVGQPSTSILTGYLGFAQQQQGGRIDYESFHVFFNPQGLTNSAVLDGFVITRGDSDNDLAINTQKSGAGMYNERSSPTLRNLVFQDNTGRAGGGLANVSSNPLLTKCVFRRNYANKIFYDEGGAIRNDNSTVRLDNCLLENNQSRGAGGAIFNTGSSSLQLIQCTLQGNNADTGGAIANNSSSILIYSSILRNNSGTQGGALANIGSISSAVNNCLLQGNTAAKGAGVFNQQSAVTLTNCTLRSNQAAVTSANELFVGGGAVYCVDDASTELRNCVAIGNWSGAFYLGECPTRPGRPPVPCNIFYITQSFIGPNITLRYTMVDDTTARQADYIDAVGNLTTSVSPFVSDGDSRLNSCTPAINAGDPNRLGLIATVGLRDLADEPRFYNAGRIDMGAYEFQDSPAFAITSQPPSGSVVCQGANVAVTVSATGVGALTYQWYKNDTLLVNQTSATLTLTSVQASSAGRYKAIITGSCGSVSTTPFSLTVTPLSPDYQPLVDLYNSTGGANWTNKTNWLTGCTPCGWYGVSCTNGRVTALNLIGNNLSGTLPASLSALVGLTSLELGANALTGGIPSGIGSLTALQTLNLSRTQLGGTIPQGLGQLTQLQNLLLNESGLTGPLPANLGELSQLQNLQLYTNQLSGCFPGNYTNLCGRAQISFTGNPGLPGGGDFAAYCSNGTGSELVVSQGPQSGTACVGSTFSFSVVARGAGIYQWYKLGPNQGQFQLLAETGPVLSFSSVSSSDAGNYQVVINYGCGNGAIQSNVVTLTVPQPGTGGCSALNTPPVASVNANQTATVGVGFSYTVNAFTDTDTSANLAYTASISPANGLSFNPATRVISGTPNEPGPVSVTITARDPGGLSASTSFSISVGPRNVGNTPLRVTLTADPQTLLTSGSTVLRATASGGNPGPPPSAYTYTFSGPGDLTSSQPNEVTVSNLPAGVQTFTVVVSDASTPESRTISATVSVTVSEANTAPTVENAIPPQSATVGQLFSYVIPANTFSDAQTPGSLSVLVSGLPQGLNFMAPATISGTPSVSGVVSVTVTATDAGGLSASTSFTITVEAAPVVATPLALTLSASPTTLLTSGTTTLSATVSGGGVGTPERPYSYTFTGPGTILASDNTAQVTNLPAGVQTFTVVASDATQPTAQTIAQTVSVTVTNAAPTNTAPIATANANQSATVGTPFAYTVAAFSDAETPGSLTYTASISPTTGLSFDPSTRVISGVPSLSGVATVSITATDPGGLSASTSFAITVSASAVTPTSPATLTITNFSCLTTAGGLSGVNFVVGYSDGTFTPALPPLFIVGVTASGQLGVPYSFSGFDGNVSTLPIADNATRQVYLVWDFRAACAGSVTPPAPTAPVAPVLANQVATQGAAFRYAVPAFSGTQPITYSASGLPAGLSFDVSSRIISGVPSLTGVSTVVIVASNSAGQGSGQFTLTVSSSAVTPTSPATLTITNFSCLTTAGGLSGVNFVVGYSDGTFTPALPPLFMVGVTASGQLGVPYSFSGFDNNVSTLSIADNATRQVYLVWDFRAACATPVTPPAPTAPVAPVLANQTAVQSTAFRYVVPTFSGTQPITYSASGLPAGLSFDASSRIISGVPSITGVSTVVISASNSAGQGSGQFTLTVSGSATPPPVGSQPLSLLAPLYDCGTGSFTFQTSGGDGSPIEYFAVGITGPTGVSGPYVVRPAGDAQPFTLRARQAGVEVTYVWDFKAVCGASARLGATEVAQSWTLRSVGNPVTGELVVEVVGAVGESLELRLSDLNGRLVESRLIKPTTVQHREVFEVSSQGAGVLLMQAQSSTRRQSLKVVKQ